MTLPASAPRKIERPHTPEIDAGCLESISEAIKLCYEFVGPGGVGTGIIGPAKVGPGGVGTGIIGPANVGPGGVGTGIIGPAKVGPWGVGTGIIGPAKVGPGVGTNASSGRWDRGGTAHHRAGRKHIVCTGKQGGYYDSTNNQRAELHGTLAPIGETLYEKGNPDVA